MGPTVKSAEWIKAHPELLNHGPTPDEPLVKMPAWGVPGEAPEEGEWPARDAVPFMAAPSEETTDWEAMKPGPVHYVSGPVPAIGVREAEVTPEMLFAANMQHEGLICDEMAADIYRAMTAVSPVPLVSDGELAAVRERDEALAVAHKYCLQAQGVEDDFREMESQVYALRADLMAAHDKLAKLTPVPDPPKPAHDFTRDFSGDRRRMGLA